MIGPLKFSILLYFYISLQNILIKWGPPAERSRRELQQPCLDMRSCSPQRASAAPLHPAAMRTSSPPPPCLISRSPPIGRKCQMTMRRCQMTRPRQQMTRSRPARADPPPQAVPPQFWSWSPPAASIRRHHKRKCWKWDEKILLSVNEYINCMSKIFVMHSSNFNFL